MADFYAASFTLISLAAECAATNAGKIFIKLTLSFDKLLLSETSLRVTK